MTSTPPENSTDWDVVIVGAGPAGMAAALYTGRAKLKTLLLDRAGMGGGQLMNTELIEDYPGIKSITGGDMAHDFEDQIRQFGVEVTWGELLRDLRRRVLQEPGAGRDRRRRQRRRGGHVPDPLRPEGLHHPPPRRVARPEAAGGGGAGQPENRGRLG